MKRVKKRIIGIDVARALAVIGMIIVNFKIVFGTNGSELVNSFASFLEGKAAAVFVVLAGVGIALMSNSAVKNDDSEKIKRNRQRLAKKALFLFVLGLSYIPIWSADILHFYGIYMVITLLLLKSSKKTILTTALLLIFIYPLFMLIWNYDTAWDYDTFIYSDFWSVNGFVRNLFYNGFHPVIPWAAFMLIGLWFGKQNLYDSAFIKKSIRLSFSLFIITLMLSKGLILLLSDGSQTAMTELLQILGTNPMPPLPFYMISGSSMAIFIISSCVFIAKRFEHNTTIIALHKTGQLALTFYVAHVMIGMGVVEIINPEKIGSYSIEFSVLYAMIFSFLCVLFAVFWTKYKNAGPLEWLMRKLTD